MVVPLHNKGPYLEEALRSVLQQSRPVHAIYVADDASADDGPQIALRLAARDERIHYLPSPSCTPAGPGATRNRAIKAGSSEFIAFLDADDWWDDNYLERQTALMTSLQTGLVHSATKTHGGAGGHQDVSVWIPGPLPPSDQQFESVRSGDYPIGCPSAVVVRRAVLEQVGGFPEDIRYGEDWDTWARMATATRFAQNREPLANVRALETYSRTRTRVEQFVLWIRVFDRWEDDERFIRLMTKRARYHFLGHQWSVAGKPAYLLFELPTTLRQHGGVVASRMFPSYASYLWSVALLPARALIRACRNMIGHQLGRGAP